MKIVYSRHYDIGFFGLERLHPFDARKFSRAWRCLKRKLQACLRDRATLDRRIRKLTGTLPIPGYTSDEAPTRYH